MNTNPYQPPTSNVSHEPHTDWVYAGFWIRVLASMIDSILILAITTPLLISIYGMDYYLTEAMVKGPADFLISFILPAVAVILFWIYRSATPGKMALKIVILDARSGQKPTTSQFIIRYFGYFLSMLPLFLGIIWVAFDNRKQGWHDKLAGTVVVRPRDSGVESARFET